MSAPAAPDRQAISEALLGSASDAVVATDRDGLIVHWSPGAERIFGHAAADAIGRSLDIIVPEAQRERHWRGFHASMASGTSRYGAGDMLKVPALTSDGGRISIEFTIAMLRDASGSATGTVAVIRDVTAGFEELRRLRRLLRDGGGTAV